MTHRELPCEEWSRLADTPLGAVWRELPTSGLTIMVVEDVEQHIVGHWTEFQASHAEQVWIRPDHQKRGIVGRHLLTAMRQRITRIGAHAFVTHAADPEVVAILEGLSATRLPGVAYSVPVGLR